MEAYPKSSGSGDKVPSWQFILVCGQWFTPSGCITVCGSCQSYAMFPPTNEGRVGSYWIVSLQILERMMELGGGSSWWH